MSAHSTIFFLESSSVMFEIDDSMDFQTLKINPTRVLLKTSKQVKTRKQKFYSILFVILVFSSIVTFVENLFASSCSCFQLFWSKLISCAITVRVLSRIANLASKYDCSNPCNFRDMTFFVVFSKKFQTTYVNFFSQNLKFPTL